jgi:hypothetical protein
MVCTGRCTSPAISGCNYEDADANIERLQRCRLLNALLMDPHGGKDKTYRTAMTFVVHSRFTSLLCAQDTGSENPYIDTNDV